MGSCEMESQECKGKNKNFWVHVNFVVIFCRDKFQLLNDNLKHLPTFIFKEIVKRIKKIRSFNIMPNANNFNSKSIILKKKISLSKKLA